MKAVLAAEEIQLIFEMKWKSELNWRTGSVWMSGPQWMGMNKRLQPKRPMRAASQSNSNQSFFVKMIDGIGLGELSELFLLGVIGGCKPQATSQQKRRANSLLHFFFQSTLPFKLKKINCEMNENEWNNWFLGVLEWENWVGYGPAAPLRHWTSLQSKQSFLFHFVNSA